jgi:hypothetical protein
VGTTDTKPDLLAQFCQIIVSRHGNEWPITEKLLAREFVEFFHLPPLFGFMDISEFSEKINVEMLNDETPNDLFGANFRFNGKRIIVICNRNDRLITQGHTFLHEIRELLENEFKSLGFPSLTLENKEDSADEFAKAASFIPFEGLCDYLFERSATLDMKWKQIGAGIGVGFLKIFMMLAVHYCAIYPQLEDLKPRERSNNVT